MSKKLSKWKSFIAGFLLTAIFSFLVTIIVGLVWNKKHKFYWYGMVSAIIISFIMGIVFFVTLLGFMINPVIPMQLLS